MPSATPEQCSEGDTQLVRRSLRASRLPQTTRRRMGGGGGDKCPLRRADEAALVAPSPREVQHLLSPLEHALLRPVGGMGGTLWPEQRRPLSGSSVGAARRLVESRRPANTTPTAAERAEAQQQFAQDDREFQRFFRRACKKPSLRHLKSSLPSTAAAALEEEEHRRRRISGRPPRAASPQVNESAAAIPEHHGRRVCSAAGHVRPFFLANLRVVARPLELSSAPDPRVGDRAAESRMTTVGRSSSVFPEDDDAAAALSNVSASELAATSSILQAGSPFACCSDSDGASFRVERAVKAVQVSCGSPGADDVEPHSPSRGSAAGKEIGIEPLSLEDQAAVLQHVADGHLDSAEQIYLSALAEAEAAVALSANGGENPDCHVLAPLLQRMVSFYLLPSWGRARPRLPDAERAARRLVLLFQDAYDTTHDCCSSISGSKGSGDGSCPAAMPGSHAPLALQEGYVDALCTLGSLLAEDGRAMDAAHALTTALRIASENPAVARQLVLKVRLRLGCAWRDAGQWQKSFHELRAAAAVARSLVAVAQPLRNPGLPPCPSDAAATAGRGDRGKGGGRGAAVVTPAEDFVVAQCALAEAADLIGHKREALQLAAEVTAFAETHFGERTAAHATAVLTAAAVGIEGCSYCAEDLHTALAASERALEFLVKSFEQQDAPEVVRAQIVVAQLRRLSGDLREGVRLFEVALSYTQLRRGPGSYFEAALLVQQLDFLFVPQVEPQLGPDAAPPQRLKLAHSIASRALAILRAHGLEYTPPAARAMVALADIHRVAGLGDAAEALPFSLHAIAVYEHLQLLDSRDYSYALNVASRLRFAALGSAPCPAPLRAALLSDLYRALAISDRFMSVVDADFYSLSSIAIVAASSPGVGGGTTLGTHQRCGGFRSTVPPLVLRRDAQRRRLDAMLQLASVHMSSDMLSGTVTMIVRDIISQFCELFPRRSPWQEEDEAFYVARLRVLAEWSMSEAAGGTSTPAADLGWTLRDLLDAENAKQATFASQQHAQDLQAQVQQRAKCAAAAATAHLSSQLKQAYTYICLQKLDNGLNLLDAALSSFASLYPSGAAVHLGMSVSAHNQFVRYMVMVRRLAIGQKQPGGEAAVDALERRVAAALQHLQELPPDFGGFFPSWPQPK